MFSCLVILISILIMLLHRCGHAQVTNWSYTCKQKLCHQNGGRIKYDHAKCIRIKSNNLQFVW